MELKGLSYLGTHRGSHNTVTFHAVNPQTGAAIPPAYHSASLAELNTAVQAAAEAFPVYSQIPGKARAAFLRRIADSIDAHATVLIERAHLESALPATPRLAGETARTSNQLRVFATLLEEGSWVQARIDPALPDRKPLPRPDLRSMLRPLGPVAVFGASNFPLAFSVAGGDTASALAAGCPVVVKGHPAHPGTSALAGDAIREAVAACKLPDGVFALLQGPANELGAALVADPRIKAVGFTGSRAGGLALVAIAQHRLEPIPVYAEMSRGNPVILLPAALGARAEAIGKSYVGSLTMGAGQFCTNPGIVFAIEGTGLDRFVAAT